VSGASSRRDSTRRIRARNRTSLVTRGPARVLESLSCRRHTNHSHKSHHLSLEDSVLTTHLLRQVAQFTALKAEPRSATSLSSASASSADAMIRRLVSSASGSTRGFGGGLRLGGGPRDPEPPPGGPFPLPEPCNAEQVPSAPHPDNRLPQRQCCDLVCRGNHGSKRRVCLLTCPRDGGFGSRWCCAPSPAPSPAAVVTGLSTRPHAPPRCAHPLPLADNRVQALHRYPAAEEYCPYGIKQVRLPGTAR
jgi:hypothetical protein